MQTHVLAPAFKSSQPDGFKSSQVTKQHVVLGGYPDEETTDGQNDGAGMIIAGLPQGMSSSDASAPRYEKSFRWEHNDGDTHLGTKGGYTAEPTWHIQGGSMKLSHTNKSTGSMISYMFRINNEDELELIRKYDSVQGADPVYHVAAKFGRISDSPSISKGLDVPSPAPSPVPSPDPTTPSAVTADTYATVGDLQSRSLQYNYIMFGILNASGLRFPTTEGSGSESITISGNTYEVRLSSNPQYGSVGSLFNPGTGFARTPDGFYTGNPNADDTTHSPYLGTESVTLSDGTALSGEWTELTLPTPTMLNRFGYNIPSMHDRWGELALIASDDRSTWSLLSYQKHDSAPTPGSFVEHITSNTAQYKYYRVISMSIIGKSQGTFYAQKLWFSGDPI